MLLGILWDDSLRFFGILWDSLGCFGMFWDVLGGFGMFWDATLGFFVVVWDYWIFVVWSGIC